MTTNTPGTPAREIHGLQVEHTIRFTASWNDPGIASGVLKQWVPAGAIITGTDVFVQTPFNAGTTNVVTVGTDPGTFTNIVAAGDVNEGATGLTQNVKPTGSALGPLGSDAQVGVMFVQSGTAATQGRAHIVIRYVPNNDPNM